MSLSNLLKMYFTFSARFSGTSRVANEFPKPKSRVPSLLHLKTLHRDALKGCVSFQAPASNSSCKLMIQVTGRKARRSRLTSGQMPSIHRGSPGPDRVWATGSLRPGLKSRRVEWVTLCCDFTLGVGDMQNQTQDRFAYILPTCYPSVPRGLTQWLLFSTGAIFFLLLSFASSSSSPFYVCFPVLDRFECR